MKDTCSRFKIDLHLHLDGSLSYKVIQQLAREEGYSIEPSLIPEKATVPKECQNLVEYLNCFDLPLLLLQRPSALTLATYDLICRLEADGLSYAEIRFAPQLHGQKGMTQQQALEAVLQGVQKANKQHFHIQTGILLCMMVTGSPAANQETAELARAYLGKGVAGLDLAGAEGAVPMSEFKHLFVNAYNADVPFTIHAGECGSYENITTAVSYGARRIGHGVSAWLSEDCMNLLEREKIVLEMCPTSNLQTKIVSSIQEHPIRRFFDRGIPVTVNTDNMTVSGTSLEQEYALIKNGLHFTENEIQIMNLNARKAAFLPLSCQ